MLHAKYLSSRHCSLTQLDLNINHVIAETGPILNSGGPNNIQYTEYGKVNTS
jgi:hypothetical protein